MNTLKMNLTQSYISTVSYGIIGAAIEVHKQLGPGLLESIYHACFIEELLLRKLNFKSQVKVPVIYKGKEVSSNLILDLLVEDLIVIELKAVEEMYPLYEAQLLTYMKLAGKPKGLLINFNSEVISKNIKSVVTDLFQALPK